jgi:hypothetical protein
VDPHAVEVELSWPARGVYAPSAFSAVNILSMAFLYGRAGRLTALFGGFRLHRADDYFEAMLSPGRVAGGHPLQVRTSIGRRVVTVVVLEPLGSRRKVALEALCLIDGGGPLQGAAGLAARLAPLREWVPTKSPMGKRSPRAARPFSCRPLYFTWLVPNEKERPARR